MDKLPQQGGIILSPEHFEHLLDALPPLGWLEFHPEDFLAMGGESHNYLERLSEHYPLSMNAMGLSIGSAESVNDKHLQNIRSLCERYSPVNLSTPLSWSRWQGTFFGTSLPLPYTVETLDNATFNLRTVQNTLGRRVLVSNTANYISFNVEQLPEGQFFSELVRHTGCGMALDLTNLYAASINAERDPFKELQNFPLAAVKEIHLAGQTLIRLDDDNLLVTVDEESAISKPVWQLYRETLNLLPRPVATLVKWRGTPSKFDSVLDELQKVDEIISSASGTQGASA